MIRFILLGIPTLTLLWWWWADRRLRALGAGGSLRIALGVAVSAIALGFGWVVLQRMEMVSAAIPAGGYALVLLWGLLALPFLALPSIAAWSLWKIGSRIVSGPAEKPAAEGWTRRKWLAAAAVTLPVWGALGATAVSMRGITRFRVRKLTVQLAGLPVALDGLRIAHLTDTHVGKFTQGRVLGEIAAATNALRADLVLFTGDLIDNAIDVLPEAIAMLQRIQPGAGLFVVEGNHDLFDDADRFRRDLHQADGFTFLRNAVATVNVRGVPVQIAGLAWNHDESRTAADVEALASQLDPTAFPILLAHHPHAFDAAGERGFPLTLAGHTHGGQIMVSDEIGGGPMMFRYWSGLYQKAAAALVVGNGTGNWFPLRVNAPAEIIEITLRRA